MDIRIMELKLLSYKQALRKAHENGDKSAIEHWTEDIATLQHQIDEFI